MSALPWAVVALLASSHVAARGDDDLEAHVQQLCQAYLEGFGADSTGLVYHHRLNGPKGLEALASPEEIAARTVGGREMPYGYGSGIQDAALENGQLLYALCDAYEATGDEYFADTARRVFGGLTLVGSVSPVRGFVPRGPHPDGKSYYPNSSRDQHATYVYALWRYHRSSLATPEDRAFIAEFLDAFARRMESNGWSIRVEDGSEVAHVGFSWRQRAAAGVMSLLGTLSAVCEVTESAEWRQLLEGYSQEDDGFRWQVLHPDRVGERSPLTLYSNQFAMDLDALSCIVTDPGKRQQIRDYSLAFALRTLWTNVFDEDCWRRLDWAGDWTEEETQAALAPFDLSLGEETTVFDLYERFDPRHFGSGDWKMRKVNGKLCCGIPTVAFHCALLSEDPELVEQVAPAVRDMVAKMLEHGHLYDRGENFNRVVVLGLHLVALQAYNTGGQ
jgi:hypothetical protein